MIRYENHRITSDSGKYVRRLADGMTATAIAAMTYTLEDYEEVDEMSEEPYSEHEYKESVERLIRERYSVADELGILRQRDTKPEEFAEYNAFAEACKAKARAEIAANGN